ncbi:DUF6514 family protein [Anaerostipes sp.]|uniref:DUF6514 family protein n=1 Tax=Anaerostipes sp. TaxID=1872530 RepID=UPI0025BF158E|nr:DUF6514 family protein [Anaerostipes sp.]MBS7008546.1 hypothetical protein [Anaerostipes sp.]
MKKEKLGTNYLEDGNGDKFVVSYYMLNDSAKDVYGAALERTTREPSVLEAEEIRGAFATRTQAERIVRLLVKYEVTPISFFEAVDAVMELEERD